MMKITEKDLYKFVFYSDELSSDKLDFIKSNMSKFKASINLLLNIKENINNDIPFNTLKNVYDKIDEHENDQQIILEPVSNEVDSEYLVLAADSPSTEPLISSKTFQDSKSKFLAKVIFNNECNKIYIFPRNKKPYNNLELTLSPSQDSYLINLKDTPLIIEPKQNIDKITLDLSKSF